MVLIILEIIGLVAIITLGFIIFLAVKLLRSDSDLQLHNSKLKVSYFSGKVVWIVGACGAIGSGLLECLSRTGCRLVLSSLPEDLVKLQNLREGLANADCAKIVVVDLRDIDSLSKKVEQATKAFGHVDIIIFASGIHQLGRLEDVSSKVDYNVMSVNYLGPAEIIRSIIPSMQSNGGGHVIGLVGLAGTAGEPYGAGYAASKFAMMGLLKSLKYEAALAGSNISTTIVIPTTSIKSSLLENSLLPNGARVWGDPDAKNLLKEFTSSIKQMKPDRVAELILIAASNKLEEVWIGTFPLLQFMYLVQYFPSLANFLMKQGNFTYTSKLSIKLKTLK